MGSIASTVLYSDIPKITISVFPPSERSLYKKRKCLKGGKSVTASSALTVIMYVPSSEARKPSPSSSVQRLSLIHILSQDIPGLVETSSNLASIKQVEGNKIKIVTSQRSSILSSRKDMSEMIRSAFLLGGAEVTTGEGYPGWKPNTDSPVLKVAVDSYKKLFGVEPKVKAIHAGLECGLFLEKYPSLDMVSFGPTLRGVHSPDERMLIPTVDKFWRHLLDVLVNIPTK